MSNMPKYGIDIENMINLTETDAFFKDEQYKINNELHEVRNALGHAFRTAETRLKLFEVIKLQNDLTKIIEDMLETDLHYTHDDYPKVEKYI